MIHFQSHQKTPNRPDVFGMNVNRALNRLLLPSTEPGRLLWMYDGFNSIYVFKASSTSVSGSCEMETWGYGRHYVQRLFRNTLEPIQFS